MSSKEENEKLKEEKENEKLKEEKVKNKKDENEDYENENENDDYDYEYEDHKTIDQNEIINKKNDNLDKIIDKSKPFEDQIKSLKKVENLDDYYYDDDFDDKELKYKYFKIKLAHLSNEIDEKLFEQIFGHTLIKLADKLINTTNKKENQIIAKNILKSKDKIFEDYYFDDWVIESNNQRINLKDTIDLILDFNENKNEDEDKDYENENEYTNEDEDDENKN